MSPGCFRTEESCSQQLGLERQAVSRDTMGTSWAMTGSGFPTQESTLDAVGGSGGEGQQRLLPFRRRWG